MYLLISLILHLFGKYILFMLVVYGFYKDSYNENTFLISTIIYIIFVVIRRYEKYKDEQLQRKYLMQQTELAEQELQRRYIGEDEEEMVTIKIPLEELRRKYPDIYNKASIKERSKETYLEE